jgi:hypothetical protein
MARSVPEADLTQRTKTGRSSDDLAPRAKARVYAAAEVCHGTKLDIAFRSYDRTRLRADGSVKIEGADVAFHSARVVPEIFEAMIRERAYDVSELGMTYFLRTFDEQGHSPFLAIPVFPARAFRHGAIYINKNSGIEKPQNLVDKRIGELALYGHDAGITQTRILSDDFGVKTGTEPLGRRRDQFPDWSH